MPTPIEQRKDLFELSTDLNLLISYRQAILNKMPRIWVLIHCNHKTKNYGLEVSNSFGSECSEDEKNEVREILRLCRAVKIREECQDSSTPKIKEKKMRKKKEKVS